MPQRSARSPSYRDDVAETLSGLLSAEPGVREERAAGGRLRWYAGTKLFAFLSREGVVLKLPADVVQDRQGRAGYRPYEMRNKPVMREWLVIDHPDVASFGEDLGLFRQSIAFVAG